MTQVERAGDRLLDRGLARFGAAWLVSFAATLFVTFIAALAARTALYDLMDRVLMLALAGLSLAWFGAVIAAFLSPHPSLPSKLLFLAVALGLLLPLLWAPVLGVVVSAWLTHAAVEYSQVYAQFRIHVAELVFPVSAGLFHVNLLDAGWNAFQVLATIVGFIAAVAQLWPMVASRFSGPATTA